MGYYGKKVNGKEDITITKVKEFLWSERQPLVKAAWNVFGDSYRYRQQYNEYKWKRMEQEKQSDGQYSFDDMEVM